MSECIFLLLKPLFMYLASKLGIDSWTTSRPSAHREKSQRRPVPACICTSVLLLRHICVTHGHIYSAEKCTFAFMHQMHSCELFCTRFTNTSY